MIALKGVTKSFETKLGTKYVLKDVDFEFPKGRDIAVMGGNGAGKTTLLRLLARADYPTKGQIISDIATSWPLGLGGGFQGSMSGRENTKFVCRIYGVEDVEDRVAFVKEFSGLGENFELPIKSYSSGMKSKFTFALSMAFDFDLYLIDEVLAVGDQAFQKKCREVLDRKRETANIILVAHSVKKMKEHCDYGVVVSDCGLVGYEDLDEALKIYQKI
ncbi:ABC transporter ATP-binding protein [Vibrio owensii]|uniref:ABC transporter ATP-binding protein n=1 Tax=Vibrio owensii TaxID=696485 RepID=UPI0018F1ED89|nr:ABC transporter ATP-binding protein [Vibrio owensii]